MLGRRCLSLLPSALPSMGAGAAAAARISRIRAPSVFAMSAQPCRSMVSRTNVLRGPEDLTPEERKEVEESEAMATMTGKPPKKILDLAEQIVQLNMLEMTDLGNVLKERLGIQDPVYGQGMMPMQMMAAPAGGGGGDAGAAPAAEPAKEKTEFVVKLESFNAADKLKVIKEIRAITGLGLKESKELVEGAPGIIKEGVNKEDSEKFKKQVEAAGGKVSVA